MAVTTRTRVFEFRALHVLPAGPAPEGLHGHTYLLEVTTAGMEATRVDAVVERLVTGPLHGGVLPITPATGEVIVEWVDRTLRNSTIGDRLLGVTLVETAKNRYVSARSEARHV